MDLSNIHEKLLKLRMIIDIPHLCNITKIAMH